MNDHFDLTNIPEGSVLLVFDRSVAFNRDRMLQAIARSGKRLYIRYARQRPGDPEETRPFYWISPEEAAARRKARREAVLKQRQERLLTLRAERAARSRGRDLAPVQIVALAQALLDAWSLANRRRKPVASPLGKWRKTHTTPDVTKSEGEPQAPNAD